MCLSTTSAFWVQVQSTVNSEPDAGSNSSNIADPGMLPFLELDSSIVKDMITVNVTAATYLCHQVTNLDDDTKDDGDITI